jgi:uncharacterized protein YbjT (DUF2867 family)
MKSILVAGATGYIGGYVVQEFKSRGHFVRALARKPSRLDPLKDSVDEIIKAEITKPESLSGICDDIDVVFSSIGITRQKDKLTFWDVDFQGNRNLLKEALKSGVKQFIYVSVFSTPQMQDLEIVKAHEAFVDELKASGINFSIIRPTAYFSDIKAFFQLAQKGRAYLIGTGNSLVNPIHGSDLAEACAEILGTEKVEMDIGGPEIFSYRDIAALAFKAVDKPAKYSAFPPWLSKLVVMATRLFSKHQGALFDFFTTAMTNDLVAPLGGKRTLESYFLQLEVEHAQP